MEIHHSKHHAGYTNNLNNAVEGSSLEGKTVEEILAGVSSQSAAVRNNGGGFYNHCLFWEVMSPNGGGNPQGALGSAIAEAFGSFEGLGIIDNEKQMFVFFCEQTSQHVQRNLLHYNRLVPVTSPEKFAVIGAMCRVSQRLDEFVYRAAMTDADRQYHRPEVAMDMFRNMSFYGLEKTLQFSWDFADGNHTASLHISDCVHNAYRQKKLFLFDNCYHQNPTNRSV
jgi:hypothetical protein